MSRRTRPLSLIERDAPAESAVLSSDESQRIVERCSKLSKADSIEIAIGSNTTGNTRFAANQMSTSGSVADVQLVVQSNYGPKHAVVVTNELTDDAIAAAVKQSEALAKLAPENITLEEAPPAEPANPPEA